MTWMWLLVLFVRTEKLLLYLVFRDVRGLRVHHLPGFDIAEKKHLGCKLICFEPEGVSELGSHCCVVCWTRTAREKGREAACCGGVASVSALLLITVLAYRFPAPSFVKLLSLDEEKKKCGKPRRGIDASIRRGQRPLAKDVACTFIIYCHNIHTCIVFLSI